MAHAHNPTTTDLVRDLATSALRATLDLIYPPVCPICEASLDRERSDNARFVCADCLQRVEWFEPPWCQRCGAPIAASIDLCSTCGHTSIPFERARAIGPYDDVLARLIQLFKFNGERALARDLSALLARRVRHDGMDAEIDAITFVPMTRAAQHERGFNHVERLARELGACLDRPVVAMLTKMRETRPQVELRERERLDNLKGAFSTRGSLPWRSVLLIDDVLTTGATVRECSRALMDGGPRSVLVATLARTPEDA